MSEKKLKKATTLDRKMFMWGVIETDVSCASLLTKKSGSGNKWDTRYVVISRNYIIYYKPQNDDGTPKQFDHCKGVINMSAIDSSEVRFVHERPNDVSFQVPVTGRVYLFKCKDEKILDRWVKAIKERADAVAAVNPETLGNVSQTITVIQAAFQKNIIFPTKVNTEGIPRFFEQTKKHLAGLDQWEPYLRKASLFLEFYFGTNRTYIDWFIGPEGPRVLFQRSEESVLSFWRNIIETTLKEAKLAGRLRFFREDFEETAQACEKAIVYIDAINQYSKEFMKNENYQDQYVMEKQAITKLIDMFRAFPPLRSVDFKTYKGGKITNKEGSEWTFVVMPHTPSQLKGIVRGSEIVFNCQAPEIMSPSYIHGSVIWNTKTWVWYHPSSPFMIRYDWNQGGAFKFKSTYQEGLPKTEYANWVLQGASLECAPEAGKVSPSALVWTVEGSVPVPVALLAAMAEVILDAQKLLNI